MTRRFRAVLCGYYGFGNLGDDLLVESLLSAFEKAGVSRSELAVLSAAPHESARSLGVRAVDRWNLKEVYLLLKESDTLLLGGGGLFQDMTSVRSCVYYWGAVRLALLAGAVPWALGQSVGPFRSAAGIFLARDAFKKCILRGVRDERSMELLASWGMESVSTPDPVFIMGDAVPKSGREGKHLLVNIRPWKGDLADRTAVEAGRLAEERGLSLIGVGLSKEDVELMEDQVRRGVFHPWRIVLLASGNWRSEGERLFPEAAGSVSMRLHFALLSLFAGLPLSLSVYDPKVEAFAREWSFPFWKGEGELLFPASTPEQDGVGRRAAVFYEEFRSLWCTAQRFLNRKGSRSS